MDKFLKNITKKIKENLPDDVEALKTDVKQNFQSAIDVKIKKLDLVTREEFEIQEEVLKRTREKLEKLEEQLNSLEKNHKQ